MSRKMRHERILQAIAASRWAITEDYLRTMLAVAHRETDLHAIERELGYRLEHTRSVTVKNGVARVPVTGPMFRYANLFVAISGATSYEELATDIGTAMADPSVRALVLDIDSPGGEVNGCAELAALVASYRGQGKPITAYVSGMGCSAAYWIAAAADHIVAHETAIAGSIGVLFSILDTSDADEEAGVRDIRIVSSQSPRKNRDPATPEGRADVQEVADSLADVFIRRVAEYRGVSAETVLAGYGQGGVFVGAAALEAGLIDGLGTLESVEAALSTGASPVALRPTKEPEMADEAEKQEQRQPDPATPDPVIEPDPVREEQPDPVASAVAAERTRITGIQALVKPGLEALAATAQQQGWSVDAFAEAAKAVDAARASAHLANLKADEAQLKAPDGVPAGSNADDGSPHAIAQRILAVHESRTANRR